MQPDLKDVFNIITTGEITVEEGGETHSTDVFVDMLQNLFNVESGAKVELLFG